MKNITTNITNKIDKQSPDLRQEMLDKLKKLYPPLFDNEGMLNQDELEQLVSDFSTPQTEKYEFNWAGKQQSKKKAFTASKATLRSDEKRSVDFNNTDNLIIEGDNLEVLKLLQKSYFGKIKCIYIDPPYNTGNDFIYPDDYSEDKQAYWEKSGVKQDGVKLDTNTDSSGRYHSKWLSMMYPRLLLARNLLKEDGAIFVSIDDNEAHNLRKLMDEVFGEENFITQVVVQTNPRGRSLDRHFAKTLEYVIVYGKNADTNTSIFEIQKGEKALAQYNKGDSQGQYRLLELRNRNPVFTRKNRPNLFYPIFINKDTGEVSLEKDEVFSTEALPLNSKMEEGCWTWGKKKFEKNKKDLIGNLASTGVWRIFRKDYIPSDGATTKEKTLWIDSSLNHENGKEEMADLFNTSGSSIPFDFPKSVEYLKKIINVSTQWGVNDVCLDFFAGSGTTAHAVMDLNKEDGGNRKFILIQIPESTDEKSEAYKAGYKTISEICIERVKRASKKIIDGGNKIDAGFKVFKLASSHFPENTFAPNPEKNDEENKKALVAYISKAISQKGLFKDGVVDLIYEIALKDGFELTLKMYKVKEFDENVVYKVTDSHKEALICVDDSLEDATIKQLERHKDQRFICLHTSLNTTKKWNLQNILGSNLWLV